MNNPEGVPIPTEGLEKAENPYGTIARENIEKLKDALELHEASIFQSNDTAYFTMYALVNNETGKIESVRESVGAADYENTETSPYALSLTHTQKDGHLIQEYTGSGLDMQAELALNNTIREWNKAKTLI